MYSVIFLTINIGISGAPDLNRFHGVKTNEYPKSSCQSIANVHSTRRCLGACAVKLDILVMISHNTESKTCMCCSDITGSDIVGLNWRTYVAPGCAMDYITVNSMCLKYVPVGMSYASAVLQCQSEGGDLVKIDSQQKFDIFKEYLVPIANNAKIQVWVQGRKVGGQWQFHDGSPMPNFCPISMSNNPEEVHLRAVGSTDFDCVDDPDINEHNYMCEYHRTLSITN